MAVSMGATSLGTGSSIDAIGQYAAQANGY